MAGHFRHPSNNIINNATTHHHQHHNAPPFFYPHHVNVNAMQGQRHPFPPPPPLHHHGPPPRHDFNLYHHYATPAHHHHSVPTTITTQQQQHASLPPYPQRQPHHQLQHHVHPLYNNTTTCETSIILNNGDPPPVTARAMSHVTQVNINNNIGINHDPPQNGSHTRTHNGTFHITNNINNTQNNHLQTGKDKTENINSNKNSLDKGINKDSHKAPPAPPPPPKEAIPNKTTVTTTNAKKKKPKPKLSKPSKSSLSTSKSTGPRPDWIKSAARRRLQQAKDELDVAQQACDAAKRAFDAAQQHLRHVQTAVKQLHHDLVEDLLQGERTRAWNQRYFQLVAFHQQFGHCIVSPRGSTRKRKHQKGNQPQPPLSPPNNPTANVISDSNNNNHDANDNGNENDDDLKANEDNNKSNSDVTGDDNRSGKDHSNKDPTNDNIDDNDDDELLDRLGRWIVKQRTEYNKGVLEEWKIVALNRLQFLWDAREITWRENYEKAKAFYTQHGHVRVPTAVDYSLQRWLKFQRACYADWKNRGFPDDNDDDADDNDNGDPQNQKNGGSIACANAGGMTRERCRLLEALNMDWKDAESRWIVLFQKLKVLFQSQGHLRTIPDNQPHLVEFADNQRHAYQQYILQQRGDNIVMDGDCPCRRQDVMTAERVALLETIHFPWSTATTRTSEMDHLSVGVATPGEGSAIVEATTINNCTVLVNKKNSCQSSNGLSLAAAATSNAKTTAASKVGRPRKKQAQKNCNNSGTTLNTLSSKTSSAAHNTAIGMHEPPQPAKDEKTVPVPTTAVNASGMTACQKRSASKDAPRNKTPQSTKRTKTSDNNNVAQAHGAGE